MYNESTLYEMLYTIMLSDTEHIHPRAKANFHFPEHEICHTSLIPQVGQKLKIFDHIEYISINVLGKQWETINNRMNDVRKNDITPMQLRKLQVTTA